MRSCQKGMTILEILVVVAIIGVVGSISVFNARRFLQGEEALGMTNTLQQMLLQGSTSASSRFRNVQLIQEQRAGARFLVLREQGSTRDIRAERVPQTVTTSLPTGTVLTFTPSGRISTTSFAALAQPVRVTGPNLIYNVEVSLIGESRYTVASR